MNKLIKLILLLLYFPLSGMFLNKVVPAIRIQAMQALKKRVLLAQALRRNYLHTNRFLYSTPANSDSLVEYTPAFSKVNSTNKSLVYRESADFNFKNFPLIFVSQQNIAPGRSEYIYVATSKKLPLRDALLKKRMILSEPENEQTEEETHEEFNKLPSILRSELKRDMNKNAKFFLKNSFNETNNLNNLLSQLPPELKSFYSTMIRDLGDNQNFQTAHCIQMQTTFHCAANDENLVTYIKTIINGYGTSNQNQDCCEKCETEKITESQKPLLLPDTIYRALELPETASDEEVKNRYFKLRLESTTQKDMQKLKYLNDIYNQYSNYRK